MMINLFNQMVLGHLVGDFVLQPKAMALQKADKGWYGTVICTLHVIVYTLSIAAFTGLWNPWVLLAVAVPHWMVDRFALAKHHLLSIGGRVPATIDSDDPYDAAFTAIMYTVVDTTIHLLFLYGLLKMLQ